jgi:hypothetical protein
MSHLQDVAYLLGDRFALLLSTEETLFFSGPDTISFGSWQGTNASLVAEETFRYQNEYNSLRVTPTSPGNGLNGSTSFSIQHSPKIVPKYLGEDEITFHAFVYPLSEVIVSVTVEDDSGNAITTDSVTLPPNFWHLVKSKPLPIQQQTAVLRCFASVSFTYAEGGNSHLHVSQPILTNYYGLADNLFLRETIAELPRYLLETDEQQVNPTFPMVRFMDVGLAYADRAFRQVDEFRYRDISSGVDYNIPSTLSELVNPETTQVDYLRWLGQFVGVTRTPARAGGTPWGFLPTTWEAIHTSIDPEPDVSYSINIISTGLITVGASPAGINEGDVISVSGTSSFDGQYQVTNINSNELTVEPSIVATTENTGQITLVDNSWTEIEFFDTRDANYEISQRNLITTQRTGFNAGTKQSIIDTLEQTLLYTKSYLYGTNSIQLPWRIYIETLVEETPEGVDGQESQYLLDQLEEVKPMGFSIRHTCRNVLGDTITVSNPGGGGDFVIYRQD